MTDHFKNIYMYKAAAYERMVAREDYHGNIFAALNDIRPMDGLNVVEFGAGTGRLTRLLAVMVNQIYAFDIAPAMLKEATQSLEMTGMTNWTFAVADNVVMSVASNCADVVIEGWSFGHAVGWYPESWRSEIKRMLSEMERIAKPGGVAILLETMTTGSKQPKPPTEGLAELYRFWEREHGFNYRWIRTDYQFASVDEADELTRFFFGDELADEIVEKQITILPECTGIWWKVFD